VASDVSYLKWDSTIKSYRFKTEICHTGGVCIRFNIAVEAETCDGQLRRKGYESLRFLRDLIVALVALAVAGLPVLQAVAAPHHLVSMTEAVFYAHGSAAEGRGWHDVSRPSHADHQERQVTSSHEHLVPPHFHAGHSHYTATASVDHDRHVPLPCHSDHCKNCVACCCAAPAMAAHMEGIELLPLTKTVSRLIAYNEWAEGLHPSPMRKPPRSI